MKNFAIIIKAMFAVFFLLQIIFYTNLYAGNSIQEFTSNKNSQIKFEPIKTEKHRIGNWSKVFTSTIILQMIDEKKIQLGTPISRFYPEIPNGDHITIEDIMTGKLYINDFLAGGKFYHRMYSDFVFEELTSASSNTNTTDFTDPNFLFLGAIVEKVSGNTYTNEVKTRIIDKVSLKNTFNYSGSPDEVKTKNPLNEWLDVWDLQSVQGAGSIVSTVYDLVQLKKSILNDHLISDKSVNVLKRILLLNNIEMFETDTVSSIVQ